MMGWLIIYLIITNMITPSGILDVSFAKKIIKISNISKDVEVFMALSINKAMYTYYVLFGAIEFFLMILIIISKM
jgi:hypothetical protein